MNITFEQAGIDDTDELVRLRIAYMKDDFGSVSEHECECLKKQLPDYYSRKLGKELIVFAARDNGRIVSTAYLHIIELPASLLHLNGIYGEVLSVYTEPEYRGRGLCSRLIENLIEYGRNAGLGQIVLSATDAGYPIYSKLGFKDKENRYTGMIYEFE